MSEKKKRWQLVGWFGHCNESPCSNKKHTSDAHCTACGEKNAFVPYGDVCLECGYQRTFRKGLRPNYCPDCGSCITIHNAYRSFWVSEEPAVHMLYPEVRPF